jgi:hypothetical protein
MTLVALAVAAVAVALASAQSLAGLQIVAAFTFGVIAGRFRAVLLALLPFFISLMQGGGADGDPPGWVAGLFFEVPVLALVIAAGVACSRLARRVRGGNRIEDPARVP